MKKRLLVYAHYYVPDLASTGQILRELAEGMGAVFDITVICVVPSYSGTVAPEYQSQKYYRENIKGVKVLRIRVPAFRKASKSSRVKNILTYFWGALKATFKTGPQDYILTISQPPILGGLLGVWGKWVKRAKLIYNIQDFNPEQISAIAYSQDKFILKLLLLLDKFTCRRSDLVVTVGRDLVQTLEHRFKKQSLPPVVMINNWVDEEQIYPLPPTEPHVLAFKKKYHLENKFIIMYSGNLGLYYDLKNLIKVIEQFPQGTTAADGREVVFAFVGAGTLQATLQNYVRQQKMTNVIFIPYQPKADLIYSLNAADVQWCVNAKGMKGVSCPSKYYGLAAVAKPILGVLETDSEIACLIKETQGGLLAEPQDYQNIRKNINWFLAHAASQELSDMGQRSRCNLEAKLTKKRSIARYQEAIRKL
ncbi:glycosyltransferase family 4 protein [Lactobacillus sp. DCY120]|uniref:Glycosyltransferase family 4 protein n=1 Tax=Bombilactobacillus apium TaxID=2675299 RepID=A0A850R5S9_9LACO|nr:glycosyltransferase family 4 protein [Bombilactobacillus apium]NVY96197.1 glycosyltransferase family 4 protein [Bombilactobacillus apium]